MITILSADIILLSNFGIFIFDRKTFYIKQAKITNFKSVIKTYHLRKSETKDNCNFLKIYYFSYFLFMDLINLWFDPSGVLFKDLDLMPPPSFAKAILIAIISCSQQLRRNYLLFKIYISSKTILIIMKLIIILCFSNVICFLLCLILLYEDQYATKSMKKMFVIDSKNEN